jgi:hypothetical protein
MKRNQTAFLFIALALSLPTASFAATEGDDDVKTLIRRYGQIEEQLPRSVHYLKTETSGDETTINQAWFDGAGDLIKVASEETAPGSRELSECFAATKIERWQPMFILTRKETTQPDGSTQVDESRQYYNGNAELIRELRKSGRFKAGESLDTVNVKNVTIDLSKKPKDERSDVEKAQARNEFYNKALQVAGSLREAGPPESDPFADVTGDSEKYRVIADSVSPDGRYAIALGLPGGKTDWEEYRDKELEEMGEAGIYTVEEEGHQNYVVDLATRKILGTTGGDYFGTKQRHNHRECTLVWSPDSKTFVELTSDKWNYDSCRAGKISPDGKKLVGMVEVGKYAEKVASNYVKSHKRHSGDDEGSIAISVSEVGNDGSIKLEVVDQISGGERKGDINSAVDEQLRLRDTPSLHLETANVRNAPKE